MIVMPITKRIGIIMSFQVCLILQMNFDYKENGERKAFLANPRCQYGVSQCGEQDYSADNKRNGDCYENPSLTHFTDEFWL